jgi:hypothetical protein
MIVVVVVVVVVVVLVVVVVVVVVSPSNVVIYKQGSQGPKTQGLFINKAVCWNVTWPRAPVYK